MRWLWAVGLAIGLAGPAEASCRLALALGLDVSGSVDAQEYRLQMDGLGVALQQEAVGRAFLQFPETPVRLMVFEWSGLHNQRIIIPWQEINSLGQLDQIGRQLRLTQRKPSGNRDTAIARAMVFGAEQIQAQPCLRGVLDISGDGPGNIGTHPTDILEEQFYGITINALVIGPQNRANTDKNLSNVKSLEAYYQSHVIRGPGAFVQPARDYPDFSRAMTSKLIRELAPPALSQLQ